MTDPRIIIGTLFIVAYYATLWVIGFRPMPVENVSLIKDAMLQLGPPVGIIIGALFRSDRRDEEATQNTGRAFDAIKAASEGRTVQIDQPADKPVPVKEE